MRGGRSVSTLGPRTVVGNEGEINNRRERERASEVYERMTRLIPKRRTTERETKERRKDVAQWQEVEVMMEKNEMSSRTGSGIYTLSSDKSPKKAKRQKKVDSFTRATDECHFARSTNSVTRNGELTDRPHWL